MHELRRRVEHLAVANTAEQPEPLALRETSPIRELLELIAALDRRVPRAERANEMSIAGDAAALKAKALRRVAELEREQASAERP
jgi:hypothetical protein